MSTVLIFIVATIALSAVVFLVLRKSAKTEAEPIGYEAAPIVVPVVEEVKKEKVVKPKTPKNTAKNKSLAKIEAKPKKATKAKK